MGKLIVPLLIGLLMGVSGGGFFSVYKASAAHAVAVADAKKHGLNPAGDSTHASVGDSTAHPAGTDVAVAPAHGAAHDSMPAAHSAEKPADAHATPSATEAHPTPVVTKPSTSATTAAPAPTTAATAPTAAETEAHQRRLAKIFATMGPKDASRVLTQMSDRDVSIILGFLSDRQAAAILTNLPAQRAAALTQLQPRRGGGTE